MTSLASIPRWLGSALGRASDRARFLRQLEALNDDDVVSVHQVQRAVRRRLFADLIPTRFGPDKRGLAQIGPYHVRYVDFPAFSYLFDDVFLHMDYWFRARTTAPRILDGGSNIGLSILYFKLLYPDARITGFEPATATFELLQENVTRNELSEVTLHRLALGASDGEVTFHESAQAGAVTNSVIAQRVDSAITETVPLRRLSTWMDEEIDFLKLDVEGAELDVLSELAASGRLRNIREASIEYHHHVGDRDSNRFGEFLGLLEDQGFGYHLSARAAGPWSRVQFQDVLVRAYRQERVAHRPEYPSPSTLRPSATHR